MQRRHCLGRLGRIAVAASAGAWLAGCATWPGSEPLRVNVVDISQLPGEGMELRMAVKLRIQNPNDTAVHFQGISLTFDVRGSAFASGVSSEAGTVPGFGEQVVTVPVSIGAFAAVRQVIGFVTGDNPKVDYELRGRLGGGLGGHHFDSRGVLELPKGFGASPSAPAAPAQ